MKLEFGIRLYAILKNWDLLLQTRLGVGTGAHGPILDYNLFVNEIVAEHSYSHSFICDLWLLLHCSSRLE